MLRLAVVLHDSSDAVIIQDMDGKITTWNLGAEKMYGYSEAEGLGMNIEQITPAEKLAEQKEYFRRLAAGEAVDSFETQGIAKDGSILHVWLTVTKVLERPTDSVISTGQAIVQPVGFALLERNITERKQAEENLRASEEKYRIANEELVFQGEEKDKRAAELVIANEELAFQNKEKAARAAELVIANEELVLQKEALKQSEEQYRSLVVNINDVIYTLNAEGYITYISPVIERFAGYKAEEIIGQPFISYIYPEDRQGLMESFRRALSGQIEPAELRILRKDGTFMYVRALSRALAENGQVGLAGVMSDITERKRAEEDLRASEERFSKAFHASPSPMSISTFHDGRYVEVNEVFLKVVGYRRDEVIGFTRSELNIFEEPEDLVRAKQFFSEHGSLRDWETAARTKSGEPLICLISADRINIGGTEYLLSVTNDITERKRAEEGLRESHEKLAKTFEQTVESLASIVEMRDPYTAGHQVRVARLACAIAAEIGTPVERIGAIRTAAMLHDIGKIVVPSEILNKPGKLNALERSFVEAHVQASYEILKTIEFEFPIAEIILQHHEKLDGSGYPRGLSGDSILKEASVLAVADVIEAMASYRPYRPALPLQAALDEIGSKKGLLYDAEVGDACLRIFAEQGFGQSIWPQSGGY
jgi:PAS domain S-box-containing protein/putative nucleotidyltransferase with HDIG domain